MKKLFLATTILALSSLIGGSAFAEEEGDADESKVRGSVDSIIRWRDDNGEAKLQGYVGIGGEADLFNGLSVGAKIQTGNRTNNVFTEPYNRETGESSFMEAHVTHAYINYEGEYFVLNAGSIDVRDNSPGFTSKLYPFMGLLGARLSFKIPGMENVSFAITGANIGDGSQPDFYNREHKRRDYTEAVGFVNLDGAMLEMGWEEIHGANFYRAVVSKDLLWDIQAILEGVYDEENSSYRANLSFKVPLADYPGAPMLTLTYLHQEEEYDAMHLRRNITDWTLWGLDGDSFVIDLTSSDLAKNDGVEVKLFGQWRQYLGGGNPNIPKGERNRGTGGVIFGWGGN